MQPNLIDTALDYLYEGFNPLPLKNNKAPRLKVGHPYLYDKVADSDVVKLFENAEKIGIACGLVSGNFEVLDFDAKAGEPITNKFNQFMVADPVRDIIARYDLPVFRTPSGGYHIYYRYEGHTYPSLTLARWESGKVMIETRGHGGYVAVYPSEGYVQIQGSEIIKIATISADERGCLISVAESMTIGVNSSRRSKSGKDWPKEFDTSTPHGRYNEECAEDARSLLVEAGWIYIETRQHDGVEYWERPGKDPQDKLTTSATWGLYHNMFFCWNDNAAPFEKETAYTPFDILMLLKFNGDFKAATAHVFSLFKPEPQIADEFLSTPRIPDNTPTAQTQEEPTAPPEPVKFPLHVFPDSIQKLILEFNKALNFTPDFTAVAIMFAIATLNGNKYKLHMKGTWDAPTLFWFAVVGDPGTIKSHPITAIIRPIKKIDIGVKALHSAQMEEYEAKLTEKGSKKGLKKPSFKQIMISDVTLEAIHNVHSVNKRGIGYHKDELIGFINSMNQYKTKGSDEQFWLESFNNQSYMVNRATKDTLSIEDTMINIIGTIQPSILSKISTDNGLTDRFLYTCAEKNIYPVSLLDVAPETLKWWDNIVMHANSMFNYLDNQDTTLIYPDKAALDVWVRLDDWLVKMQKSDEHNEALKTYLSKAKTYIPRFAMLVSLIDAVCTGSPIVVTASHMERAGVLMDYFINSSREVFSDAARTDEIRGIMSAKKGLTRPEMIVELFNKGMTKAEIAKQVGVSKANVGQTITRLLDKKKQAK